MEKKLPSPSSSSSLHLKSTTSDDIVCHHDHDDAAAADNHQEQISLYGSSVSQGSTVRISNVAPERRGGRMQQKQKVRVSCQQQAMRTCTCVRDWHSRMGLHFPLLPEIFLSEYFGSVDTQFYTLAKFKPCNC